jgi:hypothetical protein
VSLTATRKEQFVVPGQFDAVQVTVLVPSGKAVPEGGEQVTVGSGSPLAEGEKVTTAEQRPRSLERSVKGGQLIVGGVLANV